MAHIETFKWTCSDWDGRPSSRLRKCAPSTNGLTYGIDEEERFSLSLWRCAVTRKGTIFLVLHIVCWENDRWTGLQNLSVHTSFSVATLPNYLRKCCFTALKTMLCNAKESRLWLSHVVKIFANELVCDFQRYVGLVVWTGHTTSSLLDDELQRNKYREQHKVNSISALV